MKRRNFLKTIAATVVSAYLPLDKIFRPEEIELIPWKEYTLTSQFSTHSLTVTGLQNAMKNMATIDSIVVTPEAWHKLS